MATPNIVPRADSEGGLGTASKYWGSAYIDTIYVGGGKVGRDADNNLDFSVDNRITFVAQGSNKLILNSSTLKPAADDGITLGNSGTGWSDLFLADGAVINFDGGEVTMTHSGSGDFTIDAADDIRFDAGGGDIVLRAGGTEYGRLSNSSGDFVIKNITADKDIIFQADDGSGGTTAYLTLDGSAANMKVDKDMRFNDSVDAEFGTSGDFKIYHDGSNTYLEQINAGTGNIVISNANDDADIIFSTDDGSGGTTAYLTLDGSDATIRASKKLNFADNTKATFGISDDLEIYHDGTRSKIENSTGDLRIIANDDQSDIVFQADNGSTGVATYFYLDGSSAAHDGSATTALYTNWPDNSYISLGTGHDLQLVHTGVNSVIQNLVGKLQITSYTDDIEIVQYADDKDIIFQSDNGTGGVQTYFFLDGSAEQVEFNKSALWTDNDYIKLGTDGDLQIYHNGSNSYIDQTGTGDLYIRNLNENRDIIFQSDDGTGGGNVETYFFLDGSASSGPFTTFLDSSKLAFGIGRDLQIYHDGSNSYIDETGDGGLYLKSSAIRLQSAGGENMIYGVADSAVYIYHNNAKKFETTSTGIAVTGGATFSSDLDIGGGGAANVRLTTRGATDDANAFAFEAANSSGASMFFVRNDAAVSVIGTFTVGADDTGHDVIFYGATSGKKMQWDESADTLIVDGVLDINGNADISGTLKINSNYTANADANDLQIGSTNTGNGGLSIITGNSNTGGIFFGDNDNNDAGRIKYIHSSNSLLFDTNRTNALTIDSSQNATFAGTVTATSYKTGSTTILQGGADVILGSSGGTGTISLTTHSSTPFKIENDDTISISSDVSITSTAASAVGGGFDGAETCDIQIGEVNQEIITTIQIDLGTGGATDIVSSGTAGDVIGENDTAAAFITKYDSTKNGVLYKAELICLETPAGGDTDINLVLNATSLAEDAASEAEGHVIIDGGAQTIGMRTESTASVITAAAGAHNDYIYLAHGGTTAGTYSAGKFLIRLYGAKATL